MYNVLLHVESITSVFVMYQEQPFTTLFLIEIILNAL